MEDKDEKMKKIDELKKNVSDSLKKDEPPKKEEVEGFWSQYWKLENIYREDFDKLIAAEALDLKMLIFELQHKHDQKDVDTKDKHTLDDNPENK